MQLRTIVGTNLPEDLIGTGLAERMLGLDGKDRLYGLGGNDELYGGGGDDLLDGGAGRDIMYGGSGSDIYRVDDAGDFVSEESTPGIDDGGVDYVVSSISYNLGSFLEKLELTGTANLRGAGNGLDNTIKGNSGSNILFGGAGSDIIYGYDGDDVLIGGLGRDYLYGGAGADTFVLRPELGFWGDRIYDFETSDRIGFYAAELGLSQGAGLSGGALDAAYFVTGTAATAVGHGQFVYNPGSLTLFWDPDGAGGVAAVPLALFSAGASVSASQIFAYGEGASVSVSTASSAPTPEDGGPAIFTIQLTHALNEDLILRVSTVNGSATGGQDFAAFSMAEVLVKAGSTAAYVGVDLINDNLREAVESFSLRIDSAVGASSGAAVAIAGATASTSIVDEGPRVVADTHTTAFGITDPAGIAYDPVTDTLFMTDSEVEEAFFHSTNFFRLGRDGSLKGSLDLPFTDEATGLAIDAANRRLFITDDDQDKVYVVNVNNPSALLWQFNTLPLGGTDPEDIAFDPVTGHLFICNGPDRTIVEVNQTGTQVFSSILLPTAIADVEAMCYDPNEQVFYVGGGFSATIWKVDRSGAIVDVITELENARNPENNRRVNVKDLELAPASDGSGETRLYVADYGWSHYADGRLIELDLGDGFNGSNWMV